MQCYRADPALTDALCEFALDNAKIAIKRQFGFAQNERVSSAPSVVPVVAAMVALGLERIDKDNGLNLRGFVARLDKIRASVRRHQQYGSRAYYQVVSDYFPANVRPL